jgi:predicted PurR-regulated permease PerM
MRGSRSNPWRWTTDQRLTYVGQFVIEILTRIRDVVYALIASVFFAYLIFDPRNPITSRLPVWIQQGVAGASEDVAAGLAGRSLAAFGHAITVLEGTLIAAVFIIVPMVTAYLLLDLNHLKQRLAAIVPIERWRTTLTILAEVDDVIGGFVRGQLLVPLTVGVLITIALTLLHVPHSATLTNGWINAPLVTGAFVLIYEAEGHLIAPNVVAKQVRLSAFVAARAS